MKRALFALILVATSNVVFAEYCGNLGITITNASDVDCNLKSYNFLNGVSQSPLPITIPAHSTTPVFYADQDTNGINLYQVYRCGANIAAFYSTQEYCGISAGIVFGFANYNNEMYLDNQVLMGSLWNSLPGKISWRIY
jgi:hypothetical protein